MSDIAGEDVRTCKNGDGRVVVSRFGRCAGLCQECIDAKRAETVAARGTSGLGLRGGRPVPQEAPDSPSKPSIPVDLAGMASALVPTARRADRALKAKKVASTEAQTALSQFRVQMEAMVNHLRRLEQDAA